MLGRWLNDKDNDRVSVKLVTYFVGSHLPVSQPPDQDVPNQTTITELAVTK